MHSYGSTVLNPNGNYLDSIYINLVHNDKSNDDPISSFKKD